LRLLACIPIGKATSGPRRVATVKGCGACAGQAKWCSPARSTKPTTCCGVVLLTHVFRTLSPRQPVMLVTSHCTRPHNTHAHANRVLFVVPLTWFFPSGLLTIDFLFRTESRFLTFPPCVWQARKNALAQPHTNKRTKARTRVRVVLRGSSSARRQEGEKRGWVEWMAGWVFGIHRAL
jgi:hypothetical protein